MLEITIELDRKLGQEPTHKSDFVSTKVLEHSELLKLLLKTDSIQIKNSF